MNHIEEDPGKVPNMGRQCDFVGIIRSGCLLWLHRAAASSAPLIWCEYIVVVDFRAFVVQFLGCFDNM